MTDLSSAIATGIATKIAGLTIPAMLAAVVVMAITPAKTVKEFVVGMISTLVFSIGLGAGLVKYFGFSEWVNDPFGLAAIGGVMFVAGLPGWLIVRAFFLWANRRRHMDLAELLKDARNGYKGARDD